MNLSSNLFGRLFLLLIIFLLLFFNLSCENPANVSHIETSSTTGSVTFGIVWENEDKNVENAVTRGISDVCGTDWDEVSWVKAAIYNGDIQEAISQNWSCSTGSGMISGVQPGIGYSLFVVGLNSDGNTVYSGEASIDVYAGQTTDAGPIVAIRSYVTKKSPSFSGAMGIDPYNHTFQWQPALGISNYCFQIRNLPWDDPDAVIVVHEHPVAGMTFTITPDHGLNEDTIYYWGVFPIGFDDSSGFDNTWSFTTGTAVSEDKYEENDSLATSWDNDGDPATWAGAWLSDIDGSGTAVFGDEDWYQIEVNDSAYKRIMIECRFEHDYGDIDLFLYDASGTLLASAESGTNHEYIDFIASSTGIYYIKTINLNSGSNTYDLYWNNVETVGVAGVWTLEYDWGCDGLDGSTVAVLYPNNRFETESSGGSWLLTDDQVSIIFGNGTTYTAPFSAYMSDVNLTAYTAYNNGSFDVTPDTLIWGQSLDIASAVINDSSSNIPSGTSVYLSFYLSNDTRFGNSAFDAIDGTMIDFRNSTGCWTAYRSSNSYDVFLGDKKMELLYSDGLLAGWYIYGTDAFTLPSSAPDGFAASGTYYIGMVIDENNDLDESDETDNSGMGFGLDYQSVFISP